MNTSQTVIVKLKGGMGNQMFQYAFGRMLEHSAKKAGHPISIHYDTTAYSDPIKKDTKRPYYLDIMNTSAVVASDADALGARNPLGPISKVTRKIKNKLSTENENVVAFYPHLFTSPYKNYYEGYWQSEKYFLPIAGEIRQEFTLKAPLGAAAQAMHDRIMADPNAVSIFYRRTDYVGHPTFDIGEQEYQTRAIARMKELVPNLRFYVMSDDIAWVKAHANLPDDSIFVSSPKNEVASAKLIPPEEEMVLASACKHHIIPNSTYAWWGAWLGQNPDKVVIAPKTWANVTTDEYKDITPPAWLRV
jgi:hypothetical protein